MTDVTCVEQRRLLYSLLGDLPSRERPVAAQLMRSEGHDGYKVEYLRLDLNGIEAVPAVLTLPRAGRGPFPVVLYNHASGESRLGKEEVLKGREQLQRPPFADSLAAHGYAALSIDAWGFGERAGRPLDDLFKEMLWRGRVLWGMMVFDSLRAIDYLVMRPDLDASRIATLGLSMGSTMAWWVAALDERIKVCVDICCLTEFEALIRHKGLPGHGVYYYVPSLLKHFSTASINLLIAPRPHLSLAGNHDPLTPADGLDVLDEALTAGYEALSAREAWRLVREETGHYETALMRLEIMNFLRKWL